MFGKSALQRMTMTPFVNQMRMVQMIPVVQRDFSTNEKAVKIRMKSVKSIKQITGAMKMVSAARMKGDLRRLDKGKYFGLDAID